MVVIVIVSMVIILKLNRKNLSSQRGFTLIELLVAVVLLSGGLLAFGVFVGAVMDRNTSNEWKSIAVSLAEERVEELMTKSLKTVVNSSDNTSQTVTVSGAPFTVTTVVTNGASGNLTNILVTIAWVDNLASSYQLLAQVHQP